MIPPLIVRRALSMGINLIAITDHNASANIAAVQKAAQGTGLTVLPGMELQTREEVHVLCIFGSLEQAYAWQSEIDEYSPNMNNRPEYFGEQYVVDETGEYLRTETKLLSTSVGLTLTETWHRIKALDGLFIPAHVTRNVYGLFPTLGLLPTDFHCDAIEISTMNSIKEATEKHPQMTGYPIVMGGDAHTLDDIHGANVFIMEQPNLDEIRKALHNQQGRSHHIDMR